METRGKLAKAMVKPSALTRLSNVCISCRRDILRRRYASAAAAQEVVINHDDRQAGSRPPSPPNTSATAIRPYYNVFTGVVLSRPPQITRDLLPFERAYFFYQKRLNERLALPFTKYFYFKKGTPAELEWKRKVRERLTAARDIGTFNPFREEGWNDELLVGARESDPEHLIKALLDDAESAGPPGESGTDVEIVKKEEVERPMPRITEDDAKGNDQSLNRLLQRTLYLLVKGPNERWTFPSAILPHGHRLRQAADQIIEEVGGETMNTWVVGNAPVGHYRFDYPKGVVDEKEKRELLGDKIFFLKARIMAGQANLSSNQLGLTEFKWLPKEEIQKLVSNKYWKMTQDMLADR